MGFPTPRPDWSRLFLLCLLTAAISACLHGLYRPERWAAPPAYAVDALESLARLRLAGDQPWATWRNDRYEQLGAPFGADWRGYPQADEPWFVLFGWLARASGLAAAAHLLLLTAHMAGAAAFYLAARALRHRPIPAAACALLFGLSFFNLFRGLPHVSFTLSFCVPPMLVLAWWLGAARRFSLRPRSILAIAAVSILSGAANPYFTLLFLELLAGAALYLWVTTRRRANVLGLALAATLTLCTFVACNLPALWQRATEPAVASALQRDYAGSEIYALRPAELFIPPPFHAVAPLRELGRHYQAAAGPRGEFPGAYLGIVPICALIWMCGHALVRTARRRGALRPAGAPLVVWIFVAAGVGGVHGVLALAGFDLFRAGNRYSVAILAAALLFLSARLSLGAARRLRPTLVASCLGVVVLLGLIDQQAPVPGRRGQAALNAQVSDDVAFTRALEAAAGPGAMVFQLPATGFPEHPAVYQMSDYAHFRPFLARPTLRFSYGHLVGSRELRWTQATAQLPPARMIERLEEAGFAALHINRTAFPDRGDAVLRAAATVDRVALPWTEASDHAAILLRPHTAPRLPDLDDPRLLPAWDPAGTSVAAIHVGSGWFGLESNSAARWRWAGDRAHLVLWNDQPRAARIRMSFRASALPPGRLALVSGDSLRWSTDLAPGTLATGRVELDLPPGPTRLDWRFDGGTRRPDGPDRRRLGFQVQDLAIESTP